MKSLSCPDRRCSRSRKSAARSIIRHGFYKTRWGKRRRYQCRTCGKTFCSTTRTPYYRLQHRRATFDEVATLSVEGMSKSAIARVKRIAWNTVHRWLERAAAWCRRFNDRKIKGLSVVELQADEIKTIVGSKEAANLDLRRDRGVVSTLAFDSGRQTKLPKHLSVFRNLSSRMNLEQIPLVVTDGFGFYEKVVRRLFGPACLYGRVIKTRRNDRIVKVERRAVLGDRWRLEQALQNSEDSVKLNTSFVERLNLTIRQGSAYLGRRTICQARQKQRLNDHLELLRCHYNFVRPHRALKFGREVRTPARQAGLTSRALTLREIFSSRLFFVASKDVIFALFETARLVSFPVRECVWRPSNN